MTPLAKTRLKIWLVVVGVFILGCVTGAALDSVYRMRARRDQRQEARGTRDTDEVFANMQRDLNLNEQQAKDIRAILDQTRNDYRALRAEVRPRYDAIRQAARTRIRALLNPAQQQRFDAKTAEHDARRNERDQDER